MTHEMHKQKRPSKGGPLRWPVIPGMRRTGLGGKPPAGDPLRCQGTKRHSDPPRQCANYRQGDSLYCPYHDAGGGIRRKRKGTQTASDMKRYVKSTTSATLAERLRQMAQEKPQERHSLEEEIDVSRALAERAIETFDKVCVQGADSTSSQAKALAIQIARDAMTHVADVVIKAAKVRAVSREVVDVELLDYVMRETTRVLEKHLTGVSRDVIDAVLHDLRAIELPDRSTSKAGRAEAGQIMQALEEMEDAMPGCDMERPSVGETYKEGS